MGLKTVREYSGEIARRAKKLRRAAPLTQAQLAEHADIPLSTYKRFEQKGLISLEGLIKVAIALRVEDNLDALFAPNVNETEFTSLEEVERALGADTLKTQNRRSKMESSREIKRKL